MTHKFEKALHFLLSLCVIDGFLYFQTPSKGRHSYSVTLSMTATKKDGGILELLPPFMDSNPLKRSIINDALINAAVENVEKLLIVTFRGCGGTDISVGKLRAYMGEVYSSSWECSMTQRSRFLDVRVVLPIERFAKSVEEFGTDPSVSVLMTDCEAKDASGLLKTINKRRSSKNVKDLSLLSFYSLSSLAFDESCFYLENESAGNESFVFSSVACGGTFDVMHSGHKKLLTCAASCCQADGILTVGVTADEMLRHKNYSDEIGSSQQRAESVKSFLTFIFPSLKTRVLVISDPFGPPAYEPAYDAIICSNETIAGAKAINDKRFEKGFEPMKIGVVRRNHAGTLSSTALREILHS
mmetsp:Transcript_2671/g.3995  ORF Transcript_2671/g.3995 Transcript_2671/m.3995 type:complete len:356 (+) Transcript_2671:2-1069(+)